MKSMTKFIAGVVLCCAGANALEFNELGHKSKSMGGVGVAMRNNPYTLFYNPALSAANVATRVGYGAGVELSYKNLLDVFDYTDRTDLNFDDVKAINALLEENFVNLKGQAAFAFKIPDVLPYGQLSLGIAYTLYGVANFTGRLNDNAKDIMESRSIGVIDFNIRRVDMVEVPVSYAISEETAAGRISVGVAAKYMNVSSRKHHQDLRKGDDMNKMFDDIIKNTGATSDSNFGLDLGVVYSPMDFESFNVGLSAKNLNAPKFKFGENGDLQIKPQVRLGLSYELLESLTLAADMDLTNNTMLSTGAAGEKEQKSQKMGLGLDFDTMFFDVRAGIAKDLRQDNGALLSFGLGFSVFDLGIVAATKSVKVEGKSIPRYIGVQLGGAFSF